MKNDNIPTCATSQDEPGQSYYLKLGREAIHGLSLEDLESLYEAINDFLDREDEILMASEDLTPNFEKSTEIYKITTFNDGIFDANYSAYAFNVEIESTPSSVILDLFLSLLSFLNQVEKMDIQCSIPGLKLQKIKSTQSRKNNLDVLLLEENDAQKKIEVIKDTPMIVKSETLTKISMAPKIKYNVQINDQDFDGLSREQVIKIQTAIGRFLENVV